LKFLFDEKQMIVISQAFDVEFEFKLLGIYSRNYFERYRKYKAGEVIFHLGPTATILVSYLFLACPGRLT